MFQKLTFKRLRLQLLCHFFEGEQGLPGFENLAGLRKDNPAKTKERNPSSQTHWLRFFLTRTVQGHLSCISPETTLSETSV